MYWTLELATRLEDAPWPATRDELLDYAIRSGAPMEVIENLQEIESRTIGGIEMKGRTYTYIGMDWIEYYGQLNDSIWISVRMSGVDFSEGTETEAIVNSLAFAA